MKKSICLTIAVILTYNLFAQVTISRKSINKTLETKKIIIEVEFPKNYKVSKLPNDTGDSISMSSVVMDYLPVFPDWNNHKTIYKDNKLKWVFYSNKSVWLSCTSVFGYGIASPGDSIYLRYDGSKFRFTGKGASKFELQHKIDLLKLKFIRPGKRSIHVHSIPEYYNWSLYLDSQLNEIAPLIDSYRSRISQQTLHNTKFAAIKRIEDDRLLAFHALWGELDVRGQQDSLRHKLAGIFDETQFRPLAVWLRSQSDAWGTARYFHYFNRMQIYRKHLFNLEDTNLNSSSKRRYLYYEAAKRNYKGLLRERLIAYVTTEVIMKELGFQDPTLQYTLNDYYSQPGYPQYKKWVKEYETKAKELKKGKRAAAFALTDTEGKLFTKQDIIGKVTLLDFWFTGCTGCIGMAAALRSIENSMKEDTNVIFLSVSVDAKKQNWLASVAQKKYTTGTGINLFTDGKGANHPMINQYNISGYPELVLIGADEDGRIVDHPVPDPRNKQGYNKLLTLLKEESNKKAIKDHVNAADGPYVIYNKDSIEAIYLNTINKELYIKKDKKSFENKDNLTLFVSTDKPHQKFKVQLKGQPVESPGVFDEPSRQFVISDIEGNFDALRKLLVSNQVIDEEFNWIFGTGHLVCIGDFMDRGKQVTEALWLIYSLEDKARAAGGYVHFILGNHEIMNLQGDTRYVDEKYINITSKLEVTYKTLFNENTELGRWLRSKNIITKIGDFLYVHAGISPAVNRLPLDISGINKLCRPYYGEKIDSANAQLLTLFSSDKASGQTSPFWFRGYYGNEDNLAAIPTMSEVDNTLRKFKVSKIVTGHTIIFMGDKITSHYNDKIINVDTDHAKGKSEALLIEGKTIYRVNEKGEKTLLQEPNPNVDPAATSK